MCSWADWRLLMDEEKLQQRAAAVGYINSSSILKHTRKRLHLLALVIPPSEYISSLRIHRSHRAQRYLTASIPVTSASVARDSHLSSYKPVRWKPPRAPLTDRQSD